MAQTKKSLNKSEWIVLDGKRQSNLSELIEMAKTIQGVKVERRDGNIWVKFPVKKSRAKKNVGSTVPFLKTVSKTSISNMYKDKKENIGSHYCAIMIK